MSRHSSRPALVRALATSAAGVLLAAAGLVAGAGSAAAGGCYAAGCEGKDPAAYCQGDAGTYRSLWLGPSGNGAVLELRYSPSCRAAWARIARSYPYNNWSDAFPTYADVIRNSDGRTYSCNVPRGGTSCYTRMVNDAGVTSYAYGEYDSSIVVYTGRTGSY